MLIYRLKPREASWWLVSGKSAKIALKCTDLWASNTQGNLWIGSSGADSVDQFRRQGYVIYPEWQITLPCVPRLRPFRLLFSNIISWTYLKCGFKQICLSKILRDITSTTLKMKMLSAIAQPPCYLPHLCWNGIPLSSKKKSMLKMNGNSSI